MLKIEIIQILIEILYNILLYIKKEFFIIFVAEGKSFDILELF